LRDDGDGPTALWITEINQHTVAHVFGDVTVEAGDRLCDTAVIGADHLAQFLWIEARGSTDVTPPPLGQ
jgi:carbonic anhydrase/acetyltransferase-like protein (isoleucine patch superfamily)